MSVSEEKITVRLAAYLIERGWRVISVHPPGGQGPFVIPREATERAIERSSFHPDLVAVRRDASESRVVVAEVKPARSQLESDLDKLKQLTKSSAALLFILFRCQTFPGGPEDGVDYDRYQALPPADFPIEFIIASGGSTWEERPNSALSPYKLTELLIPEG